MLKYKKLHMLLYTRLAPLATASPFEVVGFKTRTIAWQTNAPSRLEKDILPVLIDEKPDVIFYWGEGGGGVVEPPEWLTILKIIRAHPALQQTKIMAILATRHSSIEERESWRKRYDWVTTFPFRVVEHAKIAKNLVGEEVIGFEGVNYYLTHHGKWDIQVQPHHNILSKNNFLFYASGYFTSQPWARLLTHLTGADYNWGDRLQAIKPTIIVCFIKSQKVWELGLKESEQEILVRLSHQVTNEHQLLIGVNELLLQAGTEIVSTVIQQAKNVGGWQLFVNEYLWLEGIAPMFIDGLYKGFELVRTPVTI